MKTKQIKVLEALGVEIKPTPLSGEKYELDDKAIDRLMRSKPVGNLACYRKGD